MPSWKKVIVSGSDASLNSINVATNVVAQSFTGSLFGTASFAVSSSRAISSSFATSASFSTSASQAQNANTASYVLNAVSASFATSASRAQNATTASYVLNAVSSSFASTASFVNTLNQNVLITGSLTVGATSIGANENTLILGPPSAGGAGEGGQLLLQATGGTYTSASMLDNWQNQTRLLRGTNLSSDAVIAQWDMHSKQMSLPAYNSATAFASTPLIGLLGFDANGNILTLATSSAGLSGGAANYIARWANPTTLTTGSLWDNGTNVGVGNQSPSFKLDVSGDIRATGAVYANANGAMYFRGGDDAELWDINVANTLGVYGQQDQGTAAIKLGSGGGTITGRSGSIGINITTPNSGALHVNGGVFATSFTGSLLGTASFATTASYVLNAVSSSFATSASFATTASYALNSDLLDGRDSTVFATTGSNQFSGSQTITGSLTVTGQITAQTLNVQQVTSSIVYSSGSNIFGSSLSNTQQLTGSVSVTGSFIVATTGTEFQVTSTGVNLGNIITDVHNVTGSFNVSGSTSLLGNTLFNTSLSTLRYNQSLSINLPASGSRVAFLNVPINSVTKVELNGSENGFYQPIVLTIARNSSGSTITINKDNPFMHTHSNDILFSFDTATGNIFAEKLLATTRAFRISKVESLFGTATVLDGSLTNTGVGVDQTVTRIGQALYVTGPNTVAQGTLTVLGTTNLNNNTVVTGSFTVVTGSAVELQVTNTGVTLGSISTDVHTVTGSFNVSGSTRLIGNTTITGSLGVSSGITGSLLGTASYATQALSASFATSASRAQSAATASYVLNAISASQAISASYAITASYAHSALSASSATTSSYAFYAETASYATNITISGSINDVDYIDFDTNVGYTLAEGRLGWDSGDNNLQLGLEGGNVQYSLGEQMYQYCFNAETSSLSKGQVVFISGSQGNRIAVRLADNSGDPTSAGTLGFVAETITAGGTGWVITEGNLRKLNTIGLTPGALLYLGSTPGTYTETKPVAPRHEVRLGYVERVHATVGSIYVKIDNGYEIGELHDIVDSTTTASYGDLLVKSGSVWTNSKQLTGSYGLTGSLTADQIYASSITASNLQVVNHITASSISATSASFGFVQSVTGSAVIIGQEYIVLNTQTPAARYAGLQIYDSGSNATASIVWDSQTNHFVYENASGSTYSGGGFLSGPRNTGSLADITYPTLNRIVRGQGGDHLYDSNITDDNTTVSILINTQVTGSLNVSGGITGSLFGTASYAAQALSSSFATTASYVAVFPFTGSAIISGSLDITGSFATTQDIVVNGVNIGEGGGNIDSNTRVGTSALAANTTGANNTAIGRNSLLNNTIGANNTAVGRNSLFSNTTGGANTSLGQSALRCNTIGGNNTAVGFYALCANTTGTNNTAVGLNSLLANTTGCANTAVGANALQCNEIGFNNTALGTSALSCNLASNNTAVGRCALLSNTTGGSNTSLGSSALQSNTTGGCNVALGVSALQFNTTGINNTAVGTSALQCNTEGSSNTAVGRCSLFNNTTGIQNTALGLLSLGNNTVGGANTAVGFYSLLANTTGGSNTAVGVNSLRCNTTGASNTAVGLSALRLNTIGTSNTAVGVYALCANTTGINNTAVGSSALLANTTGVDNTALGRSTLGANTLGSLNTAVGQNSLFNNTTGGCNTAVGVCSLFGNTTGINNTAVGTNSLQCNTIGTNNTAVGRCSLFSNTIGCYNTALGTSALRDNTTGCNNTAVGLGALRSNTIGAANTAVGLYSLFANTTGINNTAVGTNTLRCNTTGCGNTSLGINSLRYNTTGISNTAVGANSLQCNTIGTSNTAVGRCSLFNNTTGIRNTAVGVNALINNTIGISNTAIGFQSLNNNTTGGCNTAVGQNSLYANTTGVDNTAVGTNSLQCNTIGSSNTAVGRCSLFNNTTGINNTAVGLSALLANTTGVCNTALGTSALGTNTTGANNTAVGLNALRCNIEGSNNTALGLNSLFANTTGISNTAVGTNALQCNTEGSSNTAVGRCSLFNNTTGINNTAIGINSLLNNTTGICNTAVGVNSLCANTIGACNTALGVNAMQSNTTGASNIAVGYRALRCNTTGASNTAVGVNALVFNTTGINNTVLGLSAGCCNTTGNNNTFVGHLSGLTNTTGSCNTFLGRESGRFIADGTTALTVADNSVFLGHGTRANADSETNQIVIGHTAIGLGSNTTVIGNTSTTHGRWFGNLLLGTSTNDGFNLNVSGSTRLAGSTVVSGSFTVITGSNVEFQVFATGVNIGANVTDAHTVTGSLNVSSGITGSLLGTASFADFATSASQAQNAITASYVLNAVSSSFATSASYALDADLLDGRDSSTFANTGSNQFNGNQTITGSLTVTGQITAQTLNVQQVTSSIVYSSGSNIFGSSLSNTQQLTGSVSVTGSLTVNNTPAILGTLSTGQVAFGTAANTVGGDNGLFWDNTNKWLGIGTTTPGFLLDLFGSSDVSFGVRTNTTGASISFRDNTTTSTTRPQLGAIANDLVFKTGTSLPERWRITSTGILQSNGAQTIQTSTGNLTLATAGGNGNIILSPNGTGNVGIGATSLLARLHVATTGTTGTTSMLVLTRASGFGQTLFEQTYDSTYFANGKTLTLKNDSGTAFIHFAGNNAGTQTNVLVPTGSVLINTTTDAGFRLDVSGSTRLNGNSIVTGSFTVVTGSAVELQVTNTGVNIGNISTDNHNVTGSLRVSGSSTIVGNTAITGSTNITGSFTVTTTATEFQVTTTGVNLGNISTDVHNVTGSLLISGSTRLNGNSQITGSLAVTTAVTSSTLLVSGSGTQRVIVQGSGSAQPIFTVQGSQGELFSITDSLSGSLFSVNDISGLPILEVFSNGDTLIGDYSAPAVYTTRRVASTTAGVNVIYSLATSSYDGVFVDYTIRSGSVGRAGNFMAMWSGSSADFTDNSINGFGTTSNFVFGASISGSNLIVSGSGSTAGWTVKTIIRGI